MLTCAIRPAGIFGEKDTTITKNLLEHGSRSSSTTLRMQLGDNDNLFDFTYVGNIAYAHMLAARSLLATFARKEAGLGAPLDHERVDGEAFNVTNDSPVYFWDMARAIWAVTGKIVEPDQVIRLPEWLLEPIGGIAETVMGIFGRPPPRLTRRSVRYSCMTRYYSCNKAKFRLRYQPLVPLDEGIERAVGYVLAGEKSAGEKKAL